MAISNLMINSGGTLLYRDDIRTVLEDFIPDLRTGYGTTVQTIEPILAYRFEFDLHGLLFTIPVDFKYHWLVARMNYMTSVQDVRRSLSYLLIPDTTEVDRLLNAIRTGRGI